jgi:CxxC motif-containing protein (DUF1111 family)
MRARGQFLTALASLAIVSTHIICAGAAQAFDPPHHSEAFPGGVATSKRGVTDRNAVSHASGNLSFAKEFNFKIGNAVFRKHCCLCLRTQLARRHVFGHACLQRADGVPNGITHGRAPVLN